MKTLSLYQPWATLVVLGAKRFETRSWTTNYRGPLLIHASKTFPKWAREFSTEPVCYEAAKLHYRASAPAGYPTGVIVGRVWLVDCISTDRWLIDHCDEVKTEAHDRQLHVQPEWWTEYELGDYSDGRFAWRLDKADVFPEPIPAKGSLGLWEFPESELEKTLEQS